jgi:nicotinamide-nucleotide amidase
MVCEVCLYEREEKEGLTLRLFGLTYTEALERLGFKPSEFEENLGDVRLRFGNPEDFKRAREILKDYVYSEGESMERVVGELLRLSGKRLSVAESCTAGLLAARLVNVAGSSEYFVGGVVVYSNELKRDLLGVREETLSRFGAVSEETCREMLLGLRDRVGTETGIAITGIAGPGGSENKPEGLTYIGVYVDEELYIDREVFNRGRNGNRFLSTQRALNMLRERLIKEMA